MKDYFSEIRQKISDYKKRNPMFAHDVRAIEKIVENHIAEYSKHMVTYRQSKKKAYLEKAQKEIEEIDRVLSYVDQVELMSLLSRG